MKVEVTYRVRGKSGVFRETVNAHQTSNAGALIMLRHPNIRDRIDIQQCIGGSMFALGGRVYPKNGNARELA